MPTTRSFWPIRHRSPGPSVFFSARGEQLGALALRHAVPAIFQYGPFARAGGLLSYGTDETEYYHLVGLYTGRILKGEKPGDLPVQESTKIELIINLKTAKALGITNSFVSARSRRRGDRVTRFCAAHFVRFWHKADIPVHSADVRFRG